MKPDTNWKWLDWIGLSLLVVLLGLSYIIRFYPEAIMDPGFPILRDKSLESYAYMDGIPYRATSIYNHEKVIYINRFVLPGDAQTETSFSVEHEVTRYSNPEDALTAFRTALDDYSPHPVYRAVNHIPGLDFTSHADKHALWCEQESEDAQPPYKGEYVEHCYYWSVYGYYYSELVMGFWSGRGGGRQFSLEIFIDLLKRADKKLLAAR